MINTENNNIIFGEQLTIVKFTTTFCGPCKMIDPILKQLEEEYTDKGVIINNCDAQINTELTKKFGVRSVPTMIFFKDGEEIDKVTGLVAKNVLAEKIEAGLKYSKDDF
jgi:thioredoxin 1